MRWEFSARTAAGLVREHGLGDRVNACTATLSKALGSYGGFVAGSRAPGTSGEPLPAPSFTAPVFRLPAWGRRWRRSRSFKTTPELGPTLLARAERFRRQLRDLGLNVMRSDEPDHSCSSSATTPRPSPLGSTEGQWHPRHGHPRADGATGHGADPPLGDAGSRRRGSASRPPRRLQRQPVRRGSCELLRRLIFIAGWAQTERTLAPLVQTLCRGESSRHLRRRFDATLTSVASLLDYE